MTPEVIHEVATSQAVWAIICIVFGGIVFREMRIENIQNRQDAKRREERLMEHLERSNESQEKTAKSLESISRNLETLEGRVDRMEKYTYKKGESE